MIYIIYNELIKHIKIGYSNNPEKRLKELQTGNSHKLCLIHTQEGTMQDEQLIHSKLKDYCLIGEWYEYDKIKHLLSNLLQGWKDIENSEHFYMVYIDTMHRYFNIKVGIDFKVLAKLCSIAHYNTGQAVVSTALRKKWCEELEASSQNLSNSFKRLINLKLIAGEKGSYIINPEVFWRGEYEEKKSL